MCELSPASFSVEFMAGMVFSAQALTMAIASPLWGAVADRYGRKLMVERAMFGGAIILTLMGFVRSAEELVLLRAIQGLITGTVSAANALVAAAAPRQRTGYAMGLLQVGLWGGVAIGPLIGGAIADVFGYRLTFVLTGALLAIAGVLVWWGVEENFVPPLKTAQTQAGFLSGWRQSLAAPGVSLTYGLRFVDNLARSMLIPIAPLFIQVLLPGTARLNTFTGLTLGLASAAGTATAIYFGRLGDRVGHQRVLKACALVAGLLYLPQVLVTDAWQLLVLQVLAGAAAGGIIPTLSALLAGYTEPGAEGSIYGLDNSVVSASRAVAPLLGAAIAHWFGLRPTFAVAGLLLLLVALPATWRLPATARESQAQVI